MIDVGVKVDLRVLDSGIFARAGRIGNDLRPAFRAARKPVMADQRDHRKNKQGPRGKWPELAAVTKARYKLDRKRGRKRPRTLLGRLPTANMIRYERKRMLVLSRVRWSGVHQRTRPYLWISRRLRRQLGDLLAANVAARLANRKSKAVR